VLKITRHLWFTVSNVFELQIFKNWWHQCDIQKYFWGDCLMKSRPVSSWLKTKVFVNFTPSVSPSFASSFAPSLLLDISCIHWPSQWIASRLHVILHVSCETISSHAEWFVFHWQCFSFVLCISTSIQHHHHRKNLHEKILFPEPVHYSWVISNFVKRLYV